MAQLPLSLAQGVWEHICLSWTLRDGVWKAYQGGKLKGRGEGLAAWHPIKPGGVLILGQEQVGERDVGLEGWRVRGMEVWGRVGGLGESWRVRGME